MYLLEYKVYYEMERYHEDKLYAKCCTDEIDELNPLVM